MWDIVTWVHADSIRPVIKPACFIISGATTITLETTVTAAIAAATNTAQPEWHPARKFIITVIVVIEWTVSIA